jgi:hypothetical protein
MMRVLGILFSTAALAATLAFPFQAAAGSTGLAPPELDAATEQMRLLFGRTERLLEGYEGTADIPGIHLDRFNLSIGEHPVPLAAFSTFVPEALKRPGDGSISIFGTGDARVALDSSGLESGGLSLGADLRLGHRMRFGGAMGYSRVSIGPDAFAEMKSLAMHGAVDRAGLAVEVVAGGGLTQAPKTHGKNKAILFSGGRAAWTMAPLSDWAPRLKVASSVSANGIADTSDRTHGSVTVTTKLAASHELPVKWGQLSPQASIERTTGMASVPYRRPSTAMRFGIAGKVLGGTALSVEHVTGLEGRSVACHTIAGKLRLTY